jgi:ureidoacrylate peracid hydrolase
MLLKKDGTALIVVDMQNAFCHLDGSITRIGHNIEMLQGAITGCQCLVEAARTTDVPIVFTRYVFRSDYRDGGLLVQELMPELAKADALKAGTWDVEVVDELTPLPGDFIIDKNRYSAFYGTGLEPVLTSLGINSLVICGVATNLCVETTARDAMQRDYRTFIVRDATGDLDQGRHEFALATLAFGFGRVVNVDDVVEAWTKKPLEIA